MPPPKDPDKYKIWRDEISATMKLRLADESIRAEHIARMTNAVQNEGARRRQGQAMKKVWADPEYKQRVVEKIHTPENKQKRVDAIREYYQDEENKVKHREATLAATAGSEMAAKHREGCKAWWADPQRSINVRKAMSSPERSALAKQNLDRHFADPEWKAMWYEKVLPVAKANFAKGKLNPANEDKRLRALAKWRGSRSRRTRIELAVERALQILRFEFVAEKSIGKYCVDFFLPLHNLIIECDGQYWHSSVEAIAHDRKRDGWLESKGFRVIRLPEQSIAAGPLGALLFGLSSVGQD